jgi:hypothetical protein
MLVMCLQQHPSQAVLSLLYFTVHPPYSYSPPDTTDTKPISSISDRISDSNDFPFYVWPIAPFPDVGYVFATIS